MAGSQSGSEPELHDKVLQTAPKPQLVEHCRRTGEPSDSFPDYSLKMLLFKAVFSSYDRTNLPFSSVHSAALNRNSEFKL